MSIRVWDYREELAEEHAEIMEAVDSVLRSGRLILGDQVRLFEEDFAAYCGAKFGVGVNSGTDALVLAMLALGVEPGDEVITVANTAIPTVSAIVSARAIPRFVDIDPATYLMDVTKLEGALSQRTKAIIAVHLFGQCVDMDAVNAVARRRGLKVIEDCAQSHGATFRGKVCGSMSDAAAFSFYPTKILGGYGDGGLICTNEEMVAARLKRLRMYGTEKTYFSVEHGYNSRLDEIHAGILRNKLRRLPQYIARRRQLAKRYDAVLASTALTLPAVAKGAGHAYYLYVVRHPERDRVMAALSARDTVVNISYPWPIHTMPAYQHLGYSQGDLPNTESAAKEIFSLPMYPGLSEEAHERVCEQLQEILA